MSTLMLAVFALAAVSALLQYLTGRRLLSMLGRGEDGIDASGAAALIRLRKQAGLVCVALILLGVGLAIAGDSMRSVEERRRLMSVEGMEIVTGGGVEGGFIRQWTGDVDGRILYHLSEEGFVALRTEQIGHTSLFLISPDGQVAFFRSLGTATTFSFWLDVKDDHLLVDLLAGNRHESYLVPRENGDWGEPRQLDDPVVTGEPLDFTLSSHREAPTVQILAEEGKWRLSGYTMWIRVASPMATTRYRSQVILERRLDR